LFLFEPSQRKLKSKKKKGENKGLAEGYCVTQQKPDKTPHSKETQKNRGTEKKQRKLKCMKFKQSQEVIEHW